MDRKDFAIGILSTTTVVFFVGLLILQTRTRPAHGAAMTTSGGGYIMTVGKAAANVAEDLVYVVDTSSERMISYRFDPFRREIRIVQGIDLAELRKPPATPARSPPRVP
jgi:hypothetical protein